LHGSIGIHYVCIVNKFMMNTELSPQESLRLIEGMIGQARRSFSRMSFYFLLWGVLLIAAMVVTYLLRDGSEGWQNGAAWGIAGALGGILSSIHGARESRRERVLNPMDGTITALWGSFVITMVLLIAFSVVNRVDATVAITLLTGLPTFLTGRIMRFVPLQVGGVLFWMAGVAMLVLNAPLATLVLYCASMVMGYIIPGILLKRYEDGLRAA
jgi:hypothetical protein